MPNMEFIGEEELYPGHVFRVYRLEDGGIVRYPKSMAPPEGPALARRDAAQYPVLSAADMRAKLEQLRQPGQPASPTPPPQHLVGSPGYSDPSDAAYRPGAEPLAPGATATVPHESMPLTSYFTPEQLAARLKASQAESATAYKSARTEADRRRDADAEFHKLLQSVIKRGGK